MKAKFVLAAAILLVLNSSSAQAQIVRKAHSQHARIKQGVRSGELTRAEAVNLRNGQKEIRQEVKAAKADGVVTTAERKEIKQDQRQESRKIARKKHNRRDRG